MTSRPPTRDELVAAARDEAAAGNPGLASLLAEEAEFCPNSRADNARVAYDFPGGQRRRES
ncbi:hypothetical protein GA0115240_176820 [Streptomyces sp. DvalAA-14]|uniref:hypothetical protein n=1 Tax=unclassified Streptomyces TaxID=2593676 RepID=UPI00081B46D1|nr:MULTISPECIES: hypothetical protein [unclassified Streptomyces]MYS25279.1 hypothetical protein [Streptomyces sp. SID4948]SCE53436.1 hypothetical protein GA0115240_176820 [Streptomyces sp. DvalAA-14]